MDNELLMIMADIDMGMYKHFKPDKVDVFTPLALADKWLEADIESLLADKDIDSAEVLLYLDDAIKKSGKEKEIRKAVDIENAIIGAEVRSDFATALDKTENGYELSSILKYSFSEQDIKNLAMLHIEER